MARIASINLWRTISNITGGPKSVLLSAVLTSGAKVVAPVLVVRRILSILRLTRIDSSIFSLLDVAFFIGLNVVPHLLVLLEKQPKHSIKFLGRLYLYFGVSTN